MGFGWHEIGQLGYCGFNCAAFDPKTPRTVWTGSTHGIFKSEDGGLGWKASRGGEPDDSVGAVARIAGGVYRPDDGGRIWRQLTEPELA